MLIDEACHAEDRHLVTRADGKRAIVCDRCYLQTPKCVIESFDARCYEQCMTEAYPHAWDARIYYGNRPEMKR